MFFAKPLRAVMIGSDSGHCVVGSEQVMLWNILMIFIMMMASRHSDNFVVTIGG